MICTECGKEIRQDAKFCPGCGAPVITCYECGIPIAAGTAVCPGCGAPQRLCPECGRPIKDGSPVCPSCGAPVNSGVPAVPAPQISRGDPLVICALILAFIFPIAGLIIGIIARKRCAPSDRKMLKAALIVAAILTVLEGIALAIFLPKLINTLNTGGKISDIFKGYFR